ncbi:hypothetical protein HVA01_23920 [Halovibrio variabilis]|uniref:Fis family transcriptional regulator n=1 Tax=Halovibrio variabilis TaxID=31910 RepID=A0A511UQ70_9GAMM|nr:hypothetical protein [Halovibrio variabilis]GEN28746.1 hypothetical protein HVA01_23920 [Halovibrio variabilis]
MIPKRERGKVERKLIASLTHACEQAKPQYQGFEWLTHRVDYLHFPDSLLVTWVFDTDAHLTQALKSETKQRLYALTATALAEADVAIDDISQHTDFDSEQACQRTHNGNWQRRLQSTAVRH